MLSCLCLCFPRFPGEALHLPRCHKTFLFARCNFVQFMHVANNTFIHVIVQERNTFLHFHACVSPSFHRALLDIFLISSFMFYCLFFLLSYCYNRMHIRAFQHDWRGKAPHFFSSVRHLFLLFHGVMKMKRKRKR